MGLSQYTDAYGLKARTFPAVLCTLAGFGLVWYFLELDYGVPEFPWPKFITGTLASAAILGLIAGLMQASGKFLVEKLMFNGKLAMPTVTLLVDEASTKLSSILRLKVVAKIKEDQNVDLPHLIAKHEDPNSIALRRDVEHCVAHMRESTRGDAFLLRENIQYGFWRNLAGGLVIISLLALVLGLIMGTSWRSFTPLMAVLFVLGLVLLITRRTAHEYAKRLFEAYTKSQD